eukprot:GEMP01078461.1.p1 GENE.GEMP01078461.1~~GEMP01078461.1.p1  ORF type:complete len:165 (+),score=2.56 GEMP01078461.1:63-557(+)
MGKMLFFLAFFPPPVNARGCCCKLRGAFIVFFFFYVRRHGSTAAVTGALAGFTAHFCRLLVPKIAFSKYRHLLVAWQRQGPIVFIFGQPKNIYSPVIFFGPFLEWVIRVYFLFYLPLSIFLFGSAYIFLVTRRFPRRASTFTLHFYIPLGFQFIHFLYILSTFL